MVSDCRFLTVNLISKRLKHTFSKFKKHTLIQHFCIIPIALTPLSDVISVSSFINNIPFSNKLESLRQMRCPFSMRAACRQQIRQKRNRSAVPVAMRPQTKAAASDQSCSAACSCTQQSRYEELGAQKRKVTSAKVVRQQIMGRSETGDKLYQIHI